MADNENRTDQNGPHSPTPIADYAILGDGYTAALVSRTGSIDWLCLPNFDSPACFAALVGKPSNGRWLLTVLDATRVDRRYLGDSFVLETTYVTPTGTARVVDAMPTGDHRADLVRRLEVLEGTVNVRHEWIVRFGYGLIEPWVSRIRDDAVVTDPMHSPHSPEPAADDADDEHAALRAVAGPDSLLLRANRLPTPGEDNTRRHDDVFTANAGDVYEFVSTWTESWRPIPTPLPVPERINATRHRWESWSSSISYRGPHRDAVVRSLLVLRMLTHSETGGIVAAPTTSLPEDFGGERNWDYRYSWLRDAAMTVEALVESGYESGVNTWRNWLLRAVAGRPEDVQIMYGVDGRRDLPEVELDHLAGYAGSKPVRVGNAAVSQVQNDVLGEVMCALDLARAVGIAESGESWALQRHLMNDLVKKWRLPDRGIWEVRGPTRDFVHSRVMCWAALDRAVRGVELYGYDGPVEQWKRERDTIHAEILEKGWNDQVGSFVQYYGSDQVDASLLQMVQVDFLPPNDPRIVATVRRIQQDLGGPGGLIKRYSTHHVDDGLEGHEHPFMVCCFWLVDALARIGEISEAEELFDTLVSLTNDVGLMSEEYDYAGRRMAGNFPQAFSHLGLVRAAHSLERARVTRALVGAEIPQTDPDEAPVTRDVHEPQQATQEDQP